MLIGLVSDTHGLFEPRLRDVFTGCELILHAGDVGKAPVLLELSRIAPVRAVRGNVDLAPGVAELPEVAAVRLGAELSALVVHRVDQRARLEPSLRRAVSRHGARVVVHGHSHRPGAIVEQGLLFVNPGSAGPRRFDLPRTAGLLDVRGRHVEVRLLDLADARLREVGRVSAEL